MSRSGYLVLEHAIDEIELGFSFRRDLGDLDELVESIRRTGGLLVPISITPQNVLIAGERRLAALRILEYRVAPVWVVTGVSDKLATVLAIKDEHALQKLLTPVEQAELYTEYKEILAEDNARKQRATRFGAGSAAAQTEPDEADPDPAAAPIEPGGHGGVESTPPHTEPAGALGKTRVQAAKAVTGRDSHSMLDQVVELQQIAARKNIRTPATSEVGPELQALKSRQGHDFDVAYVATAGPAAHEQAVQLFQREAKSGQDPELKAFARSTLPTLEHHLTMARKLATSLANTR